MAQPILFEQNKKPCLCSYTVRIGIMIDNLSLAKHMLAQFIAPVQVKSLWGKTSILNPSSVNKNSPHPGIFGLKNKYFSMLIDVHPTSVLSHHILEISAITTHDKVDIVPSFFVPLFFVLIILDLPSNFSLEIFLLLAWWSWSKFGDFLPFLFWLEFDAQNWGLLLCWFGSMVLMWCPAERFRFADWRKVIKDSDRLMVHLRLHLTELEWSEGRLWWLFWHFGSIAVEEVIGTIIDPVLLRAVIPIHLVFLSGNIVNLGYIIEISKWFSVIHSIEFTSLFDLWTGCLCINDSFFCSLIDKKRNYEINFIILVTLWGIFWTLWHFI